MSHLEPENGLLGHRLAEGEQRPEQLSLLGSVEWESTSAPTMVSKEPDRETVGSDRALPVLIA